MSSRTTRKKHGVPSIPTGFTLYTADPLRMDEGLSRFFRAHLSGYAFIDEDGKRIMARDTEAPDDLIDQEAPRTLYNWMPREFLDWAACAEDDPRNVPPCDEPHIVQVEVGLKPEYFILNASEKAFYGIERIAREEKLKLASGVEEESIRGSVDKISGDRFNDKTAVRTTRIHTFINTPSLYELLMKRPSVESEFPRFRWDIVRRSSGAQWHPTTVCAPIHVDPSCKVDQAFLLSEMANFCYAAMQRYGGFTHSGMEFTTDLPDAKNVYNRSMRRISELSPDPRMK